MPFESFMSLYSNAQKVQYVQVEEKQCDMFSAVAAYALAHCVSTDLDLAEGADRSFQKQACLAYEIEKTI